MMLEEPGVPTLSPQEAIQLAARRYDLEAVTAPLPSYIDQNFRLVAEDGAVFVLKIHNAAERPEFVEAQTLALEHIHQVAGRDIAAPRVVPTTDGRTSFELDAGGTRHVVRMFTWVPGRPLAEIEPVTVDLLDGMGEFLGVLDRALTGFSHPGLNRYLRWDLVNVLDVRQYLPYLPAERRDRVAEILDRLEAELLPVFPSLRPAVIQGDANDYNLLVDLLAPGPPRVTGIIDFGDMVLGRLACEPAIAMTYMMLGEEDPLATALPVLRGFHRAYPLTGVELDALLDLIFARLCISVTVSAHEERRNPDNDYISIQQAAVWELLVRLDEWDAEDLRQQFRDVCEGCE